MLRDFGTGGPIGYKKVQSKIFYVGHCKMLHLWLSALPNLPYAWTCVHWRDKAAIALACALCSHV